MKALNVTTTEVRESINRIAQTNDGKIVLALLQLECGFMKNMMADDPNVTQVYAAKRGVYASIRKYINPDYLVDIEYKINIVQEEVKKNAVKKGQVKKDSK